MNSNLSISWGDLLFKLASVPFILLLMATVVSQTLSLKDYSAASELSEPTDSAGFVGDRLF